MKRLWIWAGCLMLVCGACVAAHGAGAADEDVGPAGSHLTVITSDKLTFDYRKQFALFEGHVVVIDPEMKLAADTMTVRFGNDERVESIVAEGSVRIEQEDKTAWAGHATYDVASGKMTLEQEPRVQRGKDLLTGTTITFWRDENRMICEPQARLVIYPQEGGTRDKLFGE
ncbi:MAG: hypothetical protein JXB04_05495 [Kiritimatiellae bacterium]|nr:hypothetical protein [Kiritimatiellia bacterium]